MFFIIRLMDVDWPRPEWRWVFIGGLIATLLSLLVLGAWLAFRDQILPPPAEVETVEVSPGAEGAATAEEGAEEDPLDIPLVIEIFVVVIAIIVMSTGVIVGQWENLRRFPELDVAVVMGTLILPSLTPFAIDFFGGDPMAYDRQAVLFTAAFLVPTAIASVAIGVLWGLIPPRRAESLGSYLDEAAEEGPHPIERARPEPWGGWVPIGLVYWGIFIFFFTTMFTNFNGLFTGVIGSLGYWLDQHGVERGGQPWYYYIMIQLPLYEFLPAILASSAGITGLALMVKKAFTGEREDRSRINLNAPVVFPVLGFIGYWAVMNLIAYSWAGEKMPWLTTHLTLPLILLGGWMVGRTIDRIDWSRLFSGTGWIVLLLIPAVAVVLLRAVGPACLLWEANPLCNTVITENYQTTLFVDRTVEGLSATFGWIAAVLIFAGLLAAIIRLARGIRLATVARLVGLWAVVWLAFLTMRQAWLANYVNYDEATEYLVYAHSSGAVKDVLDQIEEISLKTTDGMGLRVAYDDRVSWPMLWYFRDFPNAVYFGNQPSRGLIGDAPVIVAGASNWASVEQIVGDRYYEFEYIRMWWPVEHYKVYQDTPLSESLPQLALIVTDPDLQRGLWDIFYYRDYGAYETAVADYRTIPPDLSLSEWPVSDRMRLYIRKDVFAQVWDYGVAASEIAEAVDPYATNVRELEPTLAFGVGELNRPHGVDIGPDGLIYVADTENHRIVVYERDGTLVRTIGAQGGAPAQGVLNEPWDVAVASDGSVLVADTWNYRVVRFSAEGEFLDQWGVAGPGQVTDPFALWGPRGIAVDDQDRVYVSDTGNKRIQVYSLGGRFIRQIGSGGFGEGQLDEPADVEIGPDGLVYVADTWNQRITVFNQDGTHERTWSVSAWFGDSSERPYLDVDDVGRVYVTDPDGYRVIVFTTEGEYIYSFGDFDVLNLAGAVVVDQGGGIYVVDTALGALKRFQP
ncbi:MAG: hypothetical protein GYB64_04260 [Chloroflexi bacterium]|nr:hypothetical protein [Chloroflexota bacterium]